MQAPHTEIILRHEGNELARAVVQPGEYVVGRSHEAEISADTPLLSRRHAKLTIHADHLDIEDLGSSNGTFVNGHPVQASTRLYPNQQIRLGDVHLEIRRQRLSRSPEVSLEPAQLTLRRVLPDELLTHKRYAIGTVVAQGGMGAILAAEQSAMKRHVAMKMMLANRDEGDVLRFIEEAQITGQLEHPNIVPVHEIGIDENDQLYYTMKMVRGITLQKVLELLSEGLEGTVKKYPVANLLTIFQKACDAIAFAHSKGVLHRDLKPENIMIGDFGEVLVMDWGLAKVIGAPDAQFVTPGLAVSGGSGAVASCRSDEGDIGTTMVGTIMGTPQYMSPEQARGEILDARSDIYSLGSILFHLVFLRPTVPGDNAQEIARSVARGEIPWPTARELRAWKLPHLPGGEMPDSLVAVCRKALALDPAARYTTVADLQADLTAYQSGFATSAEHAGAWRQARLFIRRNRAVSIAVAAAVLIVAIVTAGFTASVVRERNRAETTLGELRSTAPTFADQAKALVEAGQIDDALGKISYAVKLDPHNPEFLRQRAHYLQVALRLRDAQTGYREVLALRPEDESARQNLALCERLLAANAGKDDLSKPLLVELVQALLAQGRVIEANPLAQRVGQGTAGTETALRARLKSIMAQPGWNNTRLRTQPDGTISLNLNDLKVSDISMLRGFPISTLDVNDSSLTDISAVTGMPIKRLGLSNTSVSDLSALADSPIETLFLYGSQQRDLSTLRRTKLRELFLGSMELPDLEAIKGLPLVQLTFSGNKVTDLSPLRGMPLKQLTIGNNPITDFSPLLGLPLEKLDANNMNLTAVPNLKGLPLRSLNLAGNRIVSIESLAEFPLKYLNLSFNPIGDLAPIRKMPLQILDLSIDSRPLDLAPVAECRELEELVLPRYFIHEEGLKNLPKLKRARIQQLQQFFLPTKQFWAEIKPEWIAAAHLRGTIYFSGLKIPSSNPVMTDSDGSAFLDLGRADGAPLPSLAGLPVGRINLDGSTITDLSGLRGLTALRRLSLNSTKITDLKPLQGLQLIAFSAGGTPLSDITPLRGMPLQTINLSGTRVRAQDLALLASCPLQDVNLNGTGIVDVAFLQGKALRRVELSGTGVTNLDFLAAAPIESLSIYGTPVADLSALRGKPLQMLQLSRSQVRDLNPIRGLPIVDLTMNDIPGQDFAPLAALPKLERLRYSGPPERILHLRGHPTLKQVANTLGGPMIQAAEFWAAYDSRKK